MKQALRIVIFEDDQTVAKLLKNIFESQGHDVQTYEDPSLCPAYKDHGEYCNQDESCADVIISDYMMSTLTGIDLFKKQKSCGCKILDQNKALVTGTSLTLEMKKDIDELECFFIKKPFEIESILAWVEDCSSRLTKRCAEKKHLET